MTRVLVLGAALAAACCSGGPQTQTQSGDNNHVSNGTPPAYSGTAYDVSALQADLATVLQLHSPVYSDRNLGNPTNVAKWDSAAYASMLRGLQSGQAFYTALDLPTFAHMILAEAAAESTGDFTINTGSARGLMQVTPTTVVVDFQHHALAVPSADGEAVVDPNTSPNLLDPGQSVALWAWSTRNNVTAGESADEVEYGEHRATSVTRDFGNTHLAWLAGPGYDRHTLDPNSPMGQSYADYHNRIKDYFVQAQFGSAEAFETLLDSPVGATLMLFRDAPADFVP